MQEKIQIFSPIKQRILQFADSLGISRREFYQNTGISRGTLESKTGITEDTLVKFMKTYQNISPLWLISGVGNPVFTKSPKVYSIKDSNQIIKEGVPYYKNIPANAGDLVTYLEEEKPTSYINLPEISDCTAVLPVFGKSMKGIVEPGDLIAIKEINTRTEFDPSMPHLVITNEYRMIKYLQVDDQDQAIIWAVSTNHPRIKLSADNILKVYAIKGIIRIF